MAKVTGKGTVVQLEKNKAKGKCRKWQLRVPIGKDPRTGKYRTRTRRITGTYTEATKALRDFIEEIEGDRVQARHGGTFEECAAEFQVRRRGSGEFSESTHDAYDTFLKAACRHIGRADVASITRETLEAMYAAMRQGDTLSGRESSQTYIQQIHQTIGLVFDGLVRDGVLATNPCDELKAPARDTEERRALKPGRLSELVEQLDVDDEADMAYYLAAALGLRRGEICALSWGDVDFEDAVLTVAHGLSKDGKLRRTKTKAGFRRLPLSATVLDALRRHKEAQEARLAATSRRLPVAERGRYLQTDETPVILNRSYLRTSVANLDGWWRRDRVALGLDGWCLHELRHSYLSLLAERGVHPKVMQELAGHANFQTTMKIYTHVNLDSKRAAALAVESVFGGSDAAQADSSGGTGQDDAIPFKPAEAA